MARTITGVGVLDKGVALLNAVEQRPATASDLARSLGMTLSTAHRLAMALTAHGLLRRDPEGLFHLGSRFATSSLAEIARPVLEELTSETDESTQLWVRRGEMRLCVASVESTNELRTSLPVGAQLPLPQGSAARVLLGEVDAKSEGRPVHPEGWIETVSERTAGLGSVSAPVRLHGEIVAAVCLPAPLHRLQPSPGQLHGARVLEAARRIQREMADLSKYPQ